MKGGKRVRARASALTPANHVALASVIRLAVSFNKTISDLARACVCDISHFERPLSITRQISDSEMTRRAIVLDSSLRY